jgi:glutamate N-acetyltransferase/amino-acid N-acetyltransferase
MAVGSGDFGTLHPVPGVRLATVSAGIKKPGKKDVVVFEFAPGTVTAGTFTTNAFCAAPVTLCKKRIVQQAPRYFLINTGNANAGTGEPGMQAALACCDSLAASAGVQSSEVLPFSTGVIGELLPAARIQTVIPQALRSLIADGWDAAASGIMTTDTRPKGCSRQLELAGKTITLTGIAKGAGMIKPNMATMLAYVCTDLAVGRNQLQQMLDKAVNLSFNRITVDGDTSTNDCCMLSATGQSGIQYDALNAAEEALFCRALEEVCIELAKAIIRDGEGATKFVTVQINGGCNSQECLKAGYAIAESPLVKTALFASDPNWGRILAALGRAGLDNLDVGKVNILLDDVCIVSNGARAPQYTEEQGQAVLNKAEFSIVIELARGACNETLWTCDFSHDYVSINADYRS